MASESITRSEHQSPQCMSWKANRLPVVRRSHNFRPVLRLIGLIRIKWRLVIQLYGYTDVFPLRLTAKSVANVPGNKWIVYYHDIPKVVYSESDQDYEFKSSLYCSSTIVHLYCIVHLLGADKIYVRRRTDPKAMTKPNISIARSWTDTCQHIGTFKENPHN